MKCDETKDGTCKTGCWPICTRWNAVVALLSYLLFMLSILYVCVTLMPTGLSYYQSFWTHPYKTSVLLIPACAILRFILLSKLISYCYPYGSLAFKMIAATLCLFIPFPEVKFLLSSDKAVTVRDFWLPERYWNIPLIAQFVRRRFSAHDYEDEDMIIVFTNECTLIKVLFSEREMHFSFRLPNGADAKQIAVSESSLWRLKDSDGSNKLVYTEQLCYFAETEQLADRIITVVDDLKNIAL